MYAKLLKETETEDKLGIVVIIFIIGGISIGGAGLLPPLATPMTN